jgi:hypothetical protein
MRQRYSLDLEIWRNRDVDPWDRDLVQVKMEKADALMETIFKTVAAWDDPRCFAHPEDYETMQVIRQRILKSQPRNWAQNPPWSELAGTGGSIF